MLHILYNYISILEYARPYLTKREREWIYERDGVEDPAEYEIHHIIPVAYAIAVLGLAREEINAPENLTAMPRPEHRALHLPPHELRGRLEAGLPIHRTERDGELQQIAEERTRDQSIIFRLVNGTHDTA